MNQKKVIKKYILKEWVHDEIISFLGVASIGSIIFILYVLNTIIF